MKVDLDQVMNEYNSGYEKAYKNIPELVAELQAARKFMPAATTAKEIIKATKLLLSSEGLDQSQLKMYMKSLIEQYDEVIGTDGEK